MPSTASTAKPLLLGELLSPVDESSLDSAPQVDLPPVLASAVAAGVAERWGVPAERVALQWGWAHEPELDEHTEFRLIGRGLDGWFAVVFDHGGRPGFAARLRAGLVRTVAVATQELAPGHVLRRSDVREEERVAWGAPTGDLDLVAGAGWRVTATIEAGDPITEAVATPAPTISKGDRVKLTWRRGVVTVTIEGIALHDAAIGRQVSVRLKGRRGNSRGIVVGRGAARLNA